MTHVNPAYVTRPVVKYDPGMETSATALHTERVMLSFEHGKSIDIGALCYLSRETGVQRRSRGGSSTGRKVLLESYSKTRAAKIRQVIEGVAKELKSGYSSVTVAFRLRSFVAFMEWADANGHSTALDGGDCAKAAVRSYVAYLRERIRAGTMSNNTGALEQGTVISFFASVLDVDDAAHGLNALSADSKSQQVTTPPCEDSQAKVLSLCKSLFEGITSFLLENRPYPYRLSLPSYLAWSEEGLWVFPTKRWCMAPHERGANLSLTRPYLAYDYANGRLRSLAEILSMADRNKNDAVHDIERAERLIAAANLDPFSTQRQQLGKLALYAFTLLFTAQTGMNWAQVVNLPWGDDYLVGTERQKFRAIKSRAGGREVFFEIPAGFLPSFRTYLKLRDYLLNGGRCEFLFSDLVSYAGRLATFDELFRRLRIIDPHLPMVKSMQWRAAKSDWLIRNTDIATTALVLQNSERTVAASYAAGSATGHLDEMTNFLDRVSAAVVRAGQPIENSTDRAVGTCTSVDKPNPIPGATTITPDCKEPEGCLFCDKFKVHADERDTRKLLSCQYCIRRTSSMFKSEEKFQQTVSPVLGRIQQLLDEIGRTDEPMVKRITHEVLEEGELDSYWASTMAMFIELGVVQ